ncbi:MAG: MBL fold metallo-hydrolase [Halanaeroarchaeum sp.]
MRLTFLGTGSAMPDGERMQSGLLLEDGERTLLVDAGSGVLHRLARTRAGYEGVDAVLLTHHHADHVSDLLPLIKARWLAGEEAIEVVGPPGTDALLQDFFAVYEYLEGRVDVSVREVEAGSFSVAGFGVDAIETRHSLPGLAYRFDDRLTVSGDTEAFSAMGDFAAVGDVLVHDCSFPDGVDVSNHPTPSALGEALAGSDVAELYLTHLYPHTNGEHEAMIASITAHFDGEVEVAADGRTISV